MMKIAPTLSPNLESSLLRAQLSSAVGAGLISFVDMALWVDWFC